MSFEYRLRVYWEDTDAGGIVYYANYLKFIERARTEALIALGLSQTELRARLGLVFAVRALSAEFLAPARLEDQLLVTTRAGAVGGARLEMAQEVWRDATCLAKCRVTLACLGPEGRPARMPAELKAALGQLPPIDDGP
jgi:acyl-CoA thioester hydrolase